MCFVHRDRAINFSFNSKIHLQPMRFMACSSGTKTYVLFLISASYSSSMPRLQCRRFLAWVKQPSVSSVSCIIAAKCFGFNEPVCDRATMGCILVIETDWDGAWNGLDKSTIKVWPGDAIVGVVEHGTVAGVWGRFWAIRVCRAVAICGVCDVWAEAETGGSGISWAVMGGFRGHRTE